MRRSLPLVLLVVSLSAPSALGARHRAVGSPTRFDVPAAAVAANAALAEGAPGIIIAVRHHGNTYVNAWGFLDKEAGTPMRWDAVLPLASVSKQFAAAAIMRLVDEERVRVADPVRMYLPELDARYERVTIEHLLTHTSGIPDYDTQLTDFYTPMTEAQMVAVITEKPLEFTPGSSWAYTNSGFYLLAMIVERVTGRNYHQWLEETFFARLGLTDTSECDSATPDGYFRNPFDSSVGKIRPIDTTLLLGAGALCSTTLDLLQWNQALAGGVAVSPSSYAAMHADLRLSSGQTLPYGYGLATDSLDGKYPRVWHNGLVPGYESHLGWYPTLDLSIAVLTNISTGRRDYASEAANAIARELARP
jgi:CubicO group peptidase (beta-lactamase class C family)